MEANHFSIINDFKLNKLYVCEVHCQNACKLREKLYLVGLFGRTHNNGLFSISSFLSKI